MWQTIGGIACAVLALPCAAIFTMCFATALSMFGQSGGGDCDMSPIFKAAAWGGMFVSGLAIGALLWLAWMLLAISPHEPQTWDTWIIEHRKTCPTCQRAWDEADSPMCEEAFAKLQEELRK